MFPFSDSPSPMDTALYQQLQLSPPSPKPDQSLFCYPCSPSFAADAFHLGYLSAAAATPPSAAIDSPELLMMHPSMEQPPAPKVDAGNNVQGVGVGLERAARKDRHSKICTAGGMRDRRMRLSLDVARKFFALQDLLGFDKASKTVQWLLNMSKSAIREIMTDEASSECEEDGSSSLSVVDGKHKPPAEVGGRVQKGDYSEGKKPARERKAATNPKPSRKLGNAHPVPDKESRAKARERARERTREKNRMRWVTLASAINVEEATAAARVDEPSPNNSNRSSSMNMVSAELEERCSSTLNINGGRMQEMSTASEARDLILAFGNGGYGNSNYYQEQWELGGVVLPYSRFY